MLVIKYIYVTESFNLTLRRAENPAELKLVKKFIKNLTCP